jgi:hypothetical protein
VLHQILRSPIKDYEINETRSTLMEKMEHVQFWSQGLKERDNLEDLDSNERII